jgi:hypothetical protein
MNQFLFAQFHFPNLQHTFVIGAESDAAPSLVQMLLIDPALHGLS